MPPKKGKKASICEEEINIEAQEITKTYLDAALAKQAEQLKAYFKSTLKDMTNKMEELTVSLEFSQHEIVSLKEQIMEQSTLLKSKDGNMKKLENDYMEMKEKITYLENQSRRNNIRVDGIPESAGERWEDTEQKLKQTLTEKLGLEELEMELDFERAHRVGRVQNGQAEAAKPRTIVAKLYDWKLKEGILRAARRVRPPGLYINEDFAKETVMRRKEQLPQLKAAKQEGKIAYFVLDKLIIKNQSSRRSEQSRPGE